MEYEFTDPTVVNLTEIASAGDYYYSSPASPSLSPEGPDLDLGGTGEDGGVVELYSSTTTQGPPPWFTTSYPSESGNGTVDIECTFLDYNYDPVTSVIAVILFIFGILFCIFGYRCFKAVLFLTGFIFGLVIVFLICQVEDLLPQYGNVGIAMLSGFLYGLICLLVPYVGFFTLGFHGGLLAGLAAMIFFPQGYSVWMAVIYLLGVGLFGAVLNVCFPSLTILSTAMMGGAAIAVSFDYFVEKFRMANWVWSHVKGAEPVTFCWFSWLLFALWPLLLILGVIIQSLLTARGFTIHVYPYKNKRDPPRRRMTREERALARQAKYRYLYQVRTAGGDIISQDYVQSLQSKSQLDTMSTHMSTLQTSSSQGEEGDHDNTTAT